MKVILACGLSTYERVAAALDVGMHYFSFDRAEFVTELIVADESIADRLGSPWAIEKGVDVVRFLTHWSAAGRDAGQWRNEEMIKRADALIAVPGAPGNVSQMITLARRAGLLVYVDVKDCGL